MATMEHRRTKIVCTIGPSSDSDKALSGLIEAGMDVARLNFSHQTHSEHGKRIKLIHRLSRELNKTVAIMQDLPGPKIRVGLVEGEGIELKAGKPFILTTSQVVGTDEIVGVNYSSLHREVATGDRILLADGSIELKVTGIEGRKIRCKVVIGGRLSSHKGVNVTSETLKLSGMTARDKLDLEFGIKQHVDVVALSFVRKAKDVAAAKQIIKLAGSDIPVIAKIEKPEAVKNIDEILDIADGLMVARGDLGVEIPIEEVPGVQKMLIRKANAAGKPVITATQMLRSMVDSPRPTRAEVTDVANAILDGTDAVMLSEESAVGRYPIGAVKMLDKISLDAEKEFVNREFPRPPYPNLGLSTPAAISYSAYMMAHNLGAKAIVTPTMSGYTTRLVSRYRPKTPIIALSHLPETERRLCLVWGTKPCYIAELKDTPEMFNHILKAVRKVIKLKRGDRIIVTAGLPLKTAGITNLIKIMDVP